MRHATPLMGLLFTLCLGSGAVAAEPLYEDSRAAAILGYRAVGDDENPDRSVTLAQFGSQMDELSSGGYTVMKLPDIIKALKAGRKLPARTVAITFDGTDRTIFANAIPVLKARHFPFTLFLPTSAGPGAAPDWDELRNVKDAGLASFGILLAEDADDEDTRRYINNAIDTMREELNLKPSLLALSAKADPAVLKKSGIVAAFTDRVGEAYAGADMLSLPRFMQSENVADLDRFILSVTALPLPASDISPAGPVNRKAPSIGFTIADELTDDLDKLDCTAPGVKKPKKEIIGNRVELRFAPLEDIDELAINCMMATLGDDGNVRTRWLGLAFAP